MEQFGNYVVLGKREYVYQMVMYVDVFRGLLLSGIITNLEEYTVCRMLMIRDCFYRITIINGYKFARVCDRNEIDRGHNMHEDDIHELWNVIW